MSRTIIFIRLIIVLMVSALEPAIAKDKAAFDHLDLDKLWADFSQTRSTQQPDNIYPYQHCFDRAAARHAIPLSLLLAVARGESNFNSRAVSSANALGLMQILWPSTAHHLGITRKSRLFEPCVNIDAGTRYLKEMLSRYDGNLHRALGAYNYGPARVAVDGSAIPAGAHWYSGYIYQHLMHVLRERKFVRQTQPLLSFSSSTRARAFIDRISQQQPSLKLTWSKQGRKRFQVALLFDNKQELTAGLALLEEAGFSVN